MEVFQQVVLTFFASGVGAWLSIRVFPLKARQDEWVWKKRIDAQEFVFDRLSEIVFLTHNYLRSEYFGFSMAAEKFPKIVPVVFENLREIHEKSAGVGLALTSNQREILERFLVESQKIMDSASETWGEWQGDDVHAERQHTIDMLESLNQLSDKSLDEFRAHMDLIVN